MDRNHHGFTQKKSISTALQDIIETAIHHKTNCHKVAIVSIDISGAFDNTWHPAILHQMDNDDVTLTIIKIIDSYLTNRKIEFTYSTEKYVKTITSGCPQGGVLSLLLWSILKNPFLRNFKKTLC